VLRIVLEPMGDHHQGDAGCGLLHRGDEKIAENMTYTQFIPYTDRLDYLARWPTRCLRARRRKLLGIERAIAAAASISGLCCNWRVFRPIARPGAYALTSARDRFRSPSPSGKDLYLMKP